MKIVCAFLVSIAANCSVSFACSTDEGQFESVDEQSVRDSQTNLTWYRCLVGEKIVDNACSGTPELLSWNEAAAFVQKIPPGDWRIPNLEEMETIIDVDCENVTLPRVLPLTAGVQVWTSSPGFPVNDVSAIIDLADGKVWGIGRGVARYFLLVKGFQTD